MKQVKLLDCTLRDGGYVNDWEFGHDNIVTIFERLISAKNWATKCLHRRFRSPATPTVSFWI